MSTVDEDYEVSICANCGKGEEESVKLKACTACKLVKYCNRECQISHRSQHKKECKKRAAELLDIELFKQPPNPNGDCPICFLRMPLMNSGSRYQSCCGKVICNGCVYAPVYDREGNKVDNDKQNACAFCRVVAPKTDEEAIERLNKRVEANDAQAIFNLGVYYRDGRFGFEQDHTKALELYHRAGELNYVNAYNNIGNAYELGQGVEVDMKKSQHYYELSAMRRNGGQEQSRHSGDEGI